MMLSALQKKRQSRKPYFERKNSYFSPKKLIHLKSFYEFHPFYHDRNLVEINSWVICLKAYKISKIQKHTGASPVGPPTTPFCTLDPLGEGSRRLSLHVLKVQHGYVPTLFK
jgi:hypothetical protein